MIKTNKKKRFDSLLHMQVAPTSCVLGAMYSAPQTDRQTWQINNTGTDLTAPSPFMDALPLGLQFVNMAITLATIPCND
jgi:hypothetical protein